MNCEYAHDDGAYLLGALAPIERAAYERHLVGCPSCRKAVAEIAVLPGLLGRLDPAGLDRIASPPTITSRMPQLLAAARQVRRRERRVNRWRYAGVALAAAGVALVVGLGGVVWLGDDDRPAGGGNSGVPGDSGERLVAMQPMPGSAPVRAEIGITSTEWGTVITMRCHYSETADLPHAYGFRLVAHGPNGATEQVGSWVAASGDEVTFTGVTRFAATELTRLELTRHDGQPLLAYDVP